MDRWNYRKVLLDTPRLVSVKSLVSAFDMVRDADFAFDGEMHDFWEMVYIASGKAGITADERVFTLNAGQLVFHNPMEFHRICSVGGAGHRALIMAFAAAGEELQELEDRIIELDEELEQQLHKVVDKGATILEMENNGLADTGEYREAAQEFVLLTELFLMRIIKGGRNNPRPSQDGQSETYRMIARVLNENAEKNLSLPEIAALCHMSVSNLKKIFRRYSDKGVMKHFTHIKIRRAIKLLDEGLPVSQVSERLGFSSASYFSAVFKRETGYTPGAYRKRLKTGDLLVLS